MDLRPGCTLSATVYGRGSKISAQGDGQGDGLPFHKKKKQTNILQILVSFITQLKSQNIQPTSVSFRGPDSGKTSLECNIRRLYVNASIFVKEKFPSMCALWFKGMAAAAAALLLLVGA